MPPIYGIAAALHGVRYRASKIGSKPDPVTGSRLEETNDVWFPKLTTTVLFGTCKSDISVQNSCTDIQIPSGVTIQTGFQATFKEFKRTVIQTLHQQEPGHLPTQIVFGYPMEMDPDTISKELAEKYSGNLSHKRRKSKNPHRLVSVLQELITSWVNGKRFEIKRRAFMAKGEGALESDIFLIYDPPETTSINITASGEKVRLEELHRRFLSGDESAKSELMQEVIRIAKDYADFLKKTNPEHNTTRFFLTGLNKPPYNTEPRCLFISWHEDFRRAFEQTLKEELGIKHNIVVKSPLDRPSPPFADVVRTYMQDIFDKLALKS